RDLEAQGQKVVRIEKEAGRKNWLCSPLLQTALAEARAELGDLKGAIGHYEAAIGAENAAFKLRAVEQLANLRARLAVSSYRNNPAADRNAANAIAAIEDSLGMIESLNKAAGPTPERLSVQAGCWKRLAQVQAPSPDADKALENMARGYENSAKLGG